MSERTRAPRSGDRAKDQRGTVPARDADTQQKAGRGSDARGARHFDDTRRSVSNAVRASRPGNGTGPGDCISAGTIAARRNCIDVGVRHRRGVIGH